ncbi:hypothetical protein TGRUB_263320 [Toxoplasma gondii RUB]|uniref:Uncharacterized protein n=4 Tax=Toxoplasma gondii TaxID=5811 RepID=A0A086M9L0_TOXGO|nr:hypothetical protein TGFOU_263320 [Toxoplasma gondii FOU]KFG65578.1 hypothetical protein TGRUB_263320 [Toxoplasma gondii RUB]KFH10288.1 hypothetical protein TGVAND_263320 [Toxoplasma gondii VAND]PUA89889.1 hypothetical protein TGBR9_263320 [Toxoplasma gondii TgCATBr9]
MTTTSGSTMMSMESQLNCSLDDLVKMQRQAAAKGRSSQRKNSFRRGNGPKPSARGRAINKRGEALTGSRGSGLGTNNARGKDRRGRGGRTGFSGPPRNRPTPNAVGTSGKKKQNAHMPAAPKASLAQRLAQPLENSVASRKPVKSGSKKPGTPTPRRVATPVSAQRKLVRPGMRYRGVAARKSRLPTGLPRTRDGVLIGHPAVRLAARPGVAARLQGRGTASAPRGRKAVAVRKAGGISKVANAVRRATTAAARVKAGRLGAARLPNTSFNRRAHGTAASGFAAPGPRPTKAGTAAAARRRAPVAQGSRVPVVRASVPQPVQRSVPSASDLELMSKIKIMATLDKVPPPMAAQRGMTVTPPQAMVDEHGYANNGSKNAQAAHLPYNGYGGGSLSDRFSKYGPR